ncbi:MAG: GGDEF domain-containing protein [Proteobacteria bacterium]|nr:GGDEF domain-containing protein [Pseudomonadota bacterium]
MSSEVFYIVVAMMLASATLSIIFFIAWKTLGEQPYALSWSVGFLGATCQWFFTLQSDWFPSYETYWLTVNVFALVLITLGIRGHCQRTDCQDLPSNLWPYAAVVYAGIIWTTVVDAHIGFSVALIPATACVTLFLSALMIIRHREVSRPAEWAAATSMVIFAISQGIAAGMAAMQGAAGDSTYQSLYVDYNFLTLPAGYMGMGMFIIFMLASDISIDMKQLAIHDQLTGILNRRGLGEQGASAYAAFRRTGRPVSVIMTDIDRFKFINDEYGHAVGDAALVHFAELLIENRRVDDILARVGGEEFAIVLQGADLQGALNIAVGLCAKIEAHAMQIDDNTLKMTASFGVATVSNKDTCLSDTIIRADRALYRSKRAGRNQVDLESSQLMWSTHGALKPIST